MKKTIEALFKNFFSDYFKSLIFYGCLILTFFSVILSFLYHEKAILDAKNFIQKNQSYFLGLVLSHNTKTLSLILKQNKSSAITYYFQKKLPRCRQELHKVNLILGGKFFGCIIYTKNYGHIIPWTSLSMLFLTVFALTVLFFKFFKRTTVLLRRSIIFPLVQLSARLQHINELKELSHFSFVEQNILEIEHIQKALYTASTQLLETEVTFIKSKIARQVAHDIRSPLAGLNVLMDSLPAVPEESLILIRSLIQRVNDIAQNMLIQYQASENTVVNSVLSLEPITLLIQKVIAEKKLIASTNVTISLVVKTQEDYSAFALIEPTEFKRVISNLINNALEAIKTNGKLTIQLWTKNAKIHICIQDNGVGIAENLLPEVIKEGVSLSEKHGFGLGLSYAIQQIQSWEGKYRLSSALGHGTHFYFSLPLCSAARWFLEKISLKKKEHIVILSTFQQTHELLQKRYATQTSIACSHFYNHDEFPFNAYDFNLARSLFFIETDNITFLKSSEVAQHAAIILITHNYEDNALRLQCMQENIKILPKPLLESFSLIR